VTKTKTGDLYEEKDILSWLMTQKNPAGDVIEDMEGLKLLHMIEESDSLAVFFCKYATQIIDRILIIV
jgi:hypothetical protein